MMHSNKFEIYRASTAEFRIYCKRLFASAMLLTCCQRARPLNVRSRSSASESCEAIATSVLEVALSMLSNKEIFACRAPGDKENLDVDLLRKLFQEITAYNNAIVTLIEIVITQSPLVLALDLQALWPMHPVCLCHLPKGR